MNKFKKGESGNPAGRPKGVKDRRVLFAEMLDQHKEKLFEKALELALAGNDQMLKLFLDRLLPAKPRDQALVGIDLTGAIDEKVSNVMALVSNGKVTPIEANDVLAALTKGANLVEVVELKKQVSELWKVHEERNR